MVVTTSGRRTELTECEGCITGSVTAVVDELDCSLNGPADLSTNPKHMTGYGK